MILAMTLPLARRSPITIPRRDIVADASDSLTLNLALVAADRPGAAALDLAGVGPRVVLAIWQHSDLWRHDYGLASGGVNLWSGLATITSDAGGLASVTVPAGALDGAVGRLGWSVHIDYGGGLSTLCQGALHLTSGALVASSAGLDLLTDDLVPITTDADLPLET